MARVIKNAHFFFPQKQSLVFCHGFMFYNFQLLILNKKKKILNRKLFDENCLYNAENFYTFFIIRVYQISYEILTEWYGLVWIPYEFPKGWFQGSTTKYASPCPNTKPCMTADKIKLRNWLVNEGKSKIFLIFYILLQIIYCCYSFQYYSKTPTLVTWRGLLGYGLIFARTGANMINFNLSILLFTVCRNLISVLRTTLLGR
jgi:hypothetical protein